MDLWTARDAPVARIKVEPQLHVNNDWVIYPMEARVMEATIPLTLHPTDPVCKPTRRDLFRFGQVPESQCPTGCGARCCGAQRWTPETYRRMRRASRHPESYLRIRDYLLRLR